MHHALAIPVIWGVLLYLQVSSFILDKEDEAINEDDQPLSHPCDSTINLGMGGRGVLRSPRRNGTYPKDFSCSWTIQANTKMRILIASTDFAVEFSEECIWDYLEVQDGNEVARYCNYSPLSYISITNRLRLQFVTDGDYQDYGFALNYSAHADGDSDSKCNTLVDAPRVGYVTSPNYPGNYGTDTDCYYRFRAPPGMVVVFEIVDIEMASYEYDIIQALDGNSSRQSLIWTSRNEGDPGWPLRSTNRDLFVHFQSRYFESKRGFNLTYKFVLDNFPSTTTPTTTPSPIGGDADCSGIREVTSNGTLLTPRYPDLYPNDKHCIWLLRSSNPALGLQLDFETFSVEMSENCTFDHLQIFWDGSTDADVSDKFCFEDLLGKTVFSRGPNIRLEFVTDETIGLQGFRMNYRPVDRESNDCHPQCRNDEVCVPDNGEFFCLVGRLCDSNPCQNGGICIVEKTFRDCYCPIGFGGDYCQNVLNTEPLQFLYLPPYQMKKIEEGNSVVLDCGIEDPGVPFTQLWLYENRMIQNSGGESGLTTHPGGALQIAEFNEAFEGNYTCWVSTDHRSARAVVYLEFVQSCKLRIDLPPKDKNRKSGGTVLMECYVREAATLTWFKESLDGTHETITYNERISLMSNGFLQIKDARVEDSGKYICTAKSEFGCHVTRSARLQVVKSVDIRKDCGKDKTRRVTSRIYGGRTAIPGSTPWHAVFRNKTTQDTFCGGSLISNTWIVTAAHCIREFGTEFTNNNVELYLGTDNCRGEEDKQHRFSRYIVHEDYNRDAPMDNDIALIELEEPVVFTDDISPICIEPYEYISGQFFKTYRQGATVGRVVGCGKTRDYRNSRNLKEVYVPYVEDSACEISASTRGRSYTPSMICAGYPYSNLGDACKGDSGGSLTMDIEIEDELHWVLTGIVSWGVGCDQEGQFGFYTNVGRFYSWIKMHTQLYN
ncbi:hypothetical protein ScPMuIL_009026 [Solemya velum]